MLRGFIRTMGVGLSVKDQRAALSAAGLDMADEYGSVYLDDRDAAIASLMQGDKLVVASAACLGHPEHDILAALSAIGARGATVMDLETQTTIPWNPDAQAAVDFSIRGGTATRNAVAAKARRARTASGNLGGIPAVDWDQTKLKKLREMFDQNTPRQKMADMLGVSRPTLQRKLRDLGLVGSKKDGVVAVLPKRHRDVPE